MRITVRIPSTNITIVTSTSTNEVPDMLLRLPNLT
jgi:hypothetical protein